MRYIEFINKLKTIPLTQNAYEKQGLDDEYIKKLIKGYNPSQKTGVEDPTEEKNELIKLIKTYDMSETVIGMIQFLPEPLYKHDIVYFGTFEIDMLGINYPLGDIRCYEESTEHLLYNCAVDASSFLSALWELGNFLEKRSSDEKLYNDEDLADQVATYCAELAGGIQYKDFYSVLLS